MSVDDFAPAENRWISNLGGLRNRVRQELVSRQLADFVQPSCSVLDVGCGQGTQGMRLLSQGCQVTGVDQSPQLLDLFASAADEHGYQVRLLAGSVQDLGLLLADDVYDLVCAHGLLMYFDGAEQSAVLDRLLRRVAPGGRISFTVRNGHALAMRPGLRGQWPETLAAFDSLRYTNELGVEALATRLEEVEAMLAAAGFAIEAWFGVRVFNDAVAMGTPVLDDEVQWRQLLDAEDRAGRTDPYRWMASQLHIMATSKAADR